MFQTLKRLSEIEVSEWRSWVVTEARGWIGTPYELNQMAIGAGVDCARFIYAVYNKCGLIPDEKIGIFGHDFGCHTNDESYIFRMLRHASRVAEAVSFPSLKAKTGNVALMRNVGSRVYNHGGIVTDWPKLIHAAPDQVKEIDASTHWLWSGKVVQLFDPWEKMNDR
jgi:cell wall-associated NlpC family hydrolase